MEVAIVFIGITASFWVDDWRETRQDTETFHRILGEIYYGLRIDDSLLIGLAANNNHALIAASDLVLREAPAPTGEALSGRLESVFAEWQTQATLGGYTRLINTPLAIPVNDVQLSLDNTFGLYLAAQERMLGHIAELQRLASEHWWSRGVIPCNLAVDWVINDRQLAELDLRNQARPADQVVQQGGQCSTAASNASIASAAMQDEAFRTALRETIAIRRGLAGDLVWMRSVNATARDILEAYMPDISLPIQTLGLVGSATPVNWDVTRAIQMRRTSPHDWTVDVTLAAGEVKFAANGAWTINWGAPQPWVGTNEMISFTPGRVTLEGAFPLGRAQFNGVNIPVKPGRYHVTFNTRTGEYKFDPRASTSP